MTSIHRNHTLKTHQAVEERAKHTQINSEGQMVSPNGTGQVITDDTKTHYINPKTGEVMNISEYTLPSELTMSSHNEEDEVSYAPTAISKPDSSSNTQSWFQASEDNDESEEHLTDNDSDGYYDFDSDSDSETL